MKVTWFYLLLLILKDMLPIGGWNTWEQGVIIQSRVVQRSDIQLTRRTLEAPCGREKLVCEWGAGSGEQGFHLQIFWNFWRPWRGRPITVDYKCVDFYKILEVASITVDEERRSSSLKYKKLPIFMDEVYRNSNQNRINLCPHHHLVI
jgi:hypothetical protein